MKSLPFSIQSLILIGKIIHKNTKFNKNTYLSDVIIGRKDEIIFQSLHAHFEPVSGAAQNTAAAALPVEGMLES